MTARISHSSVQQLPTDFSSSPLEYVRTLYASFTQGIFAAQPAGQCRWSPNEEETEIIIQDEGVVHAQRLGTRPVITFTRGPVQAYSLGIDDMLSYSFKTGGKTKSLLIPGTMSINCSSRVDIVSERLAWFVAEAIWMQRELLMRWGFYDIGRGWAVGSPSPAGSVIQNDSGDEWFTTTVTSPFQFYRTSRRVPLTGDVVQHIEARVYAGRDPSPPQMPAYHPAGEHNPNQLEKVSYPVHPSSARPEGPRRIPHPLNPAISVTLVPLRRPRRELRTQLPGTPVDVEESSQPEPLVTKVNI